MSGWLAVDKKDCFTVHVADTQEKAEYHADNFAVRILFMPLIIAIRLLRREGKTVVNHSEEQDE